ncbi:hypothetical protein SPHINGO8AM_130197 [Sphingomonas sp. 8AM]|nr:hypothetical protein SPHINGO8AM_130197 [Sphingomonas sp. 8AM]
MRQIDHYVSLASLAGANGTGTL